MQLGNVGFNGFDLFKSLTWKCEKWTGWNKGQKLYVIINQGRSRFARTPRISLLIVSKLLHTKWKGSCCFVPGSALPSSYYYVLENPLLIHKIRHTKIFCTKGASKMNNFRIACATRVLFFFYEYFIESFPRYYAIIKLILAVDAS